MSQRVSRTDIRRKKRNNRLIVLAWIVGLAAVVIFLLYKEKSDWLYVLATLGVTVLLVIVAVSDLHYGERKSVEATELGDDAAALGSGIPATATAATAAPSDFRGAKTRRK